MRKQLAVLQRAWGLADGAGGSDLSGLQVNRLTVSSCRRNLSRIADENEARLAPVYHDVIENARFIS